MRTRARQVGVGSASKPNAAGPPDALNRAYDQERGLVKIVEGDLFDPVHGHTGHQELRHGLASDESEVHTERGKLGRAIQVDAGKVFALVTPGFCGTCHDVNLLNGFRLQEAFSADKTAPEARQDITCQDGYRGTEPG